MVSRKQISKTNLLVVAVVVLGFTSSITAARADWIRLDFAHNLFAVATKSKGSAIRKTIRNTKQAVAHATEDYTRYRIPIQGPFRGTFEPKVDVVAFLDLNDPSSAKAWKFTISRLLRNYPNEVRVSFRYYPNASSPESVSAAYAALEAMDQGFSWQMHDLLFGNQSRQTQGHIAQYAEELGLNMARYERAMTRKTHHDRIEQDMALAESARMKATPTFYLNGRRIDGALEYERIKTEVEQEIDRANQAITEGAASDRLHRIFTNE